MSKNTSRYVLLFVGFTIVLGAGALNLFTAAAQTRTRSLPAPSPTPNGTPPATVGTPPPLVVEDKNDIIKIDTELVNLNVRVVDQNNRPIINLKPGDFEIKEDGVVQSIEFFSQSEVPTDYMLLIDNSGSLRFQLEKVIDASKAIVSTNRKDDETGVMRFASRDKIEILQDFTSNRQDLNDALDSMYIDGGRTAIIDAVYLATETIDVVSPKPGNIDRKRRAIILVSDGEDRDSYYDEKALFERLNEADVQIFVVGFIDDLEKDGSLIRKSPQEKSRDFLQKLATKTGGKAYFPASVAELPTIAKDIASEMRTQYSIGYIPTNDKNDGSYRYIKVGVKDGPAAQKRIAIYRTGRTAKPVESEKPVLRSN